MKDLSQHMRSSNPNNYWVAPEGYNPNSTPDEIAPTYPVPASGLLKHITDFINALARTTLLEATASDLHFIQKSLIFRFIDDVWIKVIEVDSGTSTLAAYSAARLGYSDFAVNKKRIKKLLNYLNQFT